MALPMPPPVSPTGAGSEVKKAHDNPAAPFDTTSQRIDASGTNATSSAAPHTRVIAPFSARRRA